MQVSNAALFQSVDSFLCSGDCVSVCFDLGVQFLVCILQRRSCSQVVGSSVSNVSAVSFQTSANFDRINLSLDWNQLSRNVYVGDCLVQFNQNVYQRSSASQVDRNQCI
ncbi:hypothetical protein D3C87_1490900 [compost metagenome]